MKAFDELRKASGCDCKDGKGDSVTCQRERMKDAIKNADPGDKPEDAETGEPIEDDEEELDKATPRNALRQFAKAKPDEDDDEDDRQPANEPGESDEETEKSLTPARAALHELFEKSGAYQGKGKRTGTPGHYKYTYDEPRGKGGKGGGKTEGRIPHGIQATILAIVSNRHSEDGPEASSSFSSDVEKRGAAELAKKGLVERTGMDRSSGEQFYRLTPKGEAVAKQLGTYPGSEKKAEDGATQSNGAPEIKSPSSYDNEEDVRSAMAAHKAHAESLLYPPMEWSDAAKNASDAERKAHNDHRVALAGRLAELKKPSFREKLSATIAENKRRDSQLAKDRGIEVGSLIRAAEGKTYRVTSVDDTGSFRVTDDRGDDYGPWPASSLPKATIEPPKKTTEPPKPKSKPKPRQQQGDLFSGEGFQQDLFRAFENNPRAGLRAMHELFAKAPIRPHLKPPAGFSPVPKSSKGGYRKRQGSGYVYWYPDGKGVRETVHGGDKGAHKALLDEEHGDGPKDKRQAAKDESLQAAAKNPLARYQMRVVGDNKASAADIAKKLRQGIDNAADVCKVRPSVCSGNLGIERQDMPQIMDDPVSKLATSKDPGDRKKAKAAIAAGADPNDKRDMMTVMLDTFEKNGVKVEHGVKQHVGQLKATQAEIKAGKTIFFADAHLKGAWPGGQKCDLAKKPIVVSSDGYILDGHHRWSALLTISPDQTMTTIKVDLPMKEILRQSLNLPGVFRADLQDNIIPNDAPFTSGALKGMRLKKSLFFDLVHRGYELRRG